MPDHYLNKYCLIVNSTLSNTIHEIKIEDVFFQENVFFFFLQNIGYFVQASMSIPELEQRCVRIVLRYQTFRHFQMKKKTIYIYNKYDSTFCQIFLKNICLEPEFKLPWNGIQINEQNHNYYHGHLWIIMTSSNGNVFRVTVPLCGESTGHRWISLTKGQ